ncbi:class A beta-lactamase [Streptomyces decoyicus]|uniref:class A beta-lactamase n=1 Tax=Streptomyces decoyicus TaxID=249567 RepID=UPI0004A9E2DA|nr:class A beta-lactamase [Streptomyces decoyicus]KOG45002.1 beta-lactamase [Streptomyces decoyicus]QZY19634.1 class A beta-lactamase [Streptomyces decoyicus]
MISSKRRTALSAATLVLASGLLSGCTGSSDTGPAGPASSTASASTDSAPSRDRAAKALAQVERRFHARLGVYMLDTGTGRTVTYRAGERFAHASTFKALAAGVVLKRSTDDELNRVIRYSASDLEDYAPITKRHVDQGMTLRDLVKAALQYSDNTAANLLLDQLGGPAGLQKALRAMGDATTRVNRTEPTLNEAKPGDTRDTSTPRTLGTDLRGFVLGDVLPEGRRQLLTGWLRGNTTGGPYIRAGVPSGWKVGDKTGNGGYGTRNDIAIVWPASGAPVVVAVLSDRGSKDAASDDALIKDATKAGLAALR